MDIFVQIDVSVLRKELRHQQYELNNLAIDTARAHRWILQNGPYLEDLEQRMANVSLASLALIYDLDFGEADHALHDAFLTARLWQKLMPKLGDHEGGKTARRAEDRESLIVNTTREESVDL